MCNEPGRAGPETQILPKTRHKTEFLAKFEFLTQDKKHDYSLQSQEVKDYFISTAQDNATKNSYRMSGIHRHKQGCGGSNIVFLPSFSLMVRVFERYFL